MSAFVSWFMATPSPTPFPGYTGDPNVVTPGVIGFITILVIALVTIFLIIDMNRRMRVVRYREEARQKIAAEAAEAAAGDDEAPSAPVEPTDRA